MSGIGILEGPVAQAIGWALLHLLWQGAVVAAILAAALALLARRSANVRYIVSCSALAVLLVLGIATAVRAYEPSIATKTAMPSIAMTTVAAEAMTVPVPVAPVPFTTRFLAAARESLPRIVLIWFVGVALLSSRLLMTWLRTQRLARVATAAANEEWQRIVARLSASMRLRRAVRLAESAMVEVPSVVGWLRPIILLPASAVTAMPIEQLEMVLAHELAHIRRHDFFINLMQAVVETLMFYHPAVWWMSRRVRIERENCCDDLAVAVCGDAIRYARALTRLEELRADAPEMVMAANGGPLLARIRRLAGLRSESIGHGTRWIAAVTMFAILTLIVAIPSLPALAQREEEPKKPSTTIEVKTVEVTDDDATVDLDIEPPDVIVPVAPVPPVPPVPPVAPHPVLARLHPMIVPVPPAPPAPPAAPAPPAPPAPPVPGADFEYEYEFGDRGHGVSDRPIDAPGKLTVDELISLRAVGVTPDYIRTMRELFPGVTIRNLMTLRATGVTPEYIREMRAAGFDLKSARDASNMKALGVSADWLASMKAAGIEVKMAKDAIGLRAAGVTPDFVQRMAKAGFTNLSVRDLKRLAAVGIDDDFIRDMEQYRKK